MTPEHSGRICTVYSQISPKSLLASILLYPYRLMYNKLLQLPALWLTQRPLRQLLQSQEDPQGHRNALWTEHVVSIRRNLDLQLRWCARGVLAFALIGIFVQFDAKLEA